MKNERKRLTLFWFSFYSLLVLGRLHKIAEDANNLSSTEQAVKTLPKQHKSFSFIFHHFCLFICCLSVILWLDKWDIPENVHTVCPC